MNTFPERAPRYFVPILAVCLAAAALYSPRAAAPGQSAVSLSGAAVVPAPRIAEHIPLSGVGNFGRVTENLYRGAQPSSEGFSQLKKLGVGLIVNFRDDRGEQQREQRIAETLGLRYVVIGWNARKEPTDAQVAEFLALVRDHPQTKIFAHCHLGADRTGVMIATYRIAEDHWTAAQALEEMKAFHFHFWLPHLKRYVSGFPTRLHDSPGLQVVAAP